MRNHNHDNKLKCDTAGYKGWREVKFHEGKNPDGTFRTTQGFKNVLTNQEVTSKEPPVPTGDLACVRHCSDAYRRGYDQIKWERQPEA
jgi:hypothetical protein